jgi:hypothetical protein
VRLSERLGVRPLPQLRLDEVSERLRVGVWNAVHLTSEVDADVFYKCITDIAHQLRWPLNDHAGTSRIFLLHLKQWFLTGAKGWDFYDSLDIVGCGVAPVYGESERDKYWDFWNGILEDDGAGYCFVKRQFVALTNETEIQEVEHAAESGVPMVARQVLDALKHLPPASDPNPRNAIKEAISAVEAALRHVTGEPSATLAKALPTFEAKFGELRRRPIPQRAVRPALIEVLTPRRDDGARFVQRAEPMLIQALVAELAVAAFHICVLRRLAGLAQAQLHPHAHKPIDRALCQ